MKQFDAIVIGAGPGGYVCAIRLAQLGIKTACVEKEYFGGVCLNVGCIPSKAMIHAASTIWKIRNEAAHMGINVSEPKLDLAKTQAWKNGVVKQLTGGISGLFKNNGVESFKGNATFKDAKTLEVKLADGKTETITAKNIVIATGSRPVEVPILKYNGKNIVDSTGALDFQELPKKLVVIGGGFIGVEIGMAYAKMGAKVTIVEFGPSILPAIDRDLVQVVEKKMRKLGIEVLANTKATGLQEKDAAKATTLHLEVESQGKKSVVEASHILVSVGRKPNTDGIGLEKVGVKLDERGNIITNNLSQTGVPGVYAIGDAAGAPQLAHRAMMDGQLVAATIAGEPSYKDYKTVPWAVFCDPEIAVAGLSEKEATEKGIKYKVGKFPFAANGRALSVNDTDGFIKVLLAEPHETVIGVHIVGPEASNLIAEATLAIEMGACAEDVIRTIHTHPTLPEAMPEAIEAAFYKTIHIYKAPPKGASAKTDAHA
jgi:dihydrolipoamide dehydrogenase